MSKNKIVGIEKHTYAPELTRVIYSNGASIALNKLLIKTVDLNAVIQMLYYESNRVSAIIKLIKQCLQRSPNTGKYVTIYRIDNKYRTNTFVAQGYYFNVATIKGIIDKDFLKHGLPSSEYKTIITFKMNK